MKAFKELTIVSPDKERKPLISFLDYLKTNLTDNWCYREDLAKDYSTNVYKEIDEIGCFQSPLRYQNQALLWLVLVGNELRILNIVPVESGKLGIELYNQFLDNFKESNILPIARLFHVDVVTTAGQKKISEIIGADTYSKLDRWEQICNKENYNGHDLDFKLWAEFLITAMKSNSKITASLLERWLVEERNWRDSDSLDNVVQDFEYGLDLLKYYDGNNQL